MKTKSIVLMLAGALLAAPAAANVPPPPAAQGEQSASEVVLAFMENLNAASAEGVASTLSDGGAFYWIENGRVSSSDKASAVEGFKAMIGAGPGVRMETDNSMRVMMLGDSAAEAIVPFTFFAKDDKGAEAPVFVGVMTMAVAPDADGIWRIRSGHISSSGAE